MKKILWIVLLFVGLCIALFLVVQVLPIGQDHTNPPVSGEPNWDSPRTRERVHAGVRRLSQQRDGLALVQQYPTSFLAGCK